MTAIDNYKISIKKLFELEGIEPKSKFVSTTGPVKNIHYYETGKGSPLIIIHGGGSHALQTYPLIKQLQENFHLYIPDRPGCGLTDGFDYNNIDVPDHAADFINSFMEALGIDKAIILGNSMGGLFAISFALKYPKMVEKLLLVGHPTGCTRKIPFILRLLGAKGINKFLLKLLGTPTKKASKQLYGQLLVADAAKMPDEYFENDVCAALLPGAGESFISLLENCMRINGLKKSYLVSSRLKELVMPVHFIIGSQDKFDTIENLKQIIAGMKNGQLEIVEGGGHILWFDNAAACGSLIAGHAAAN